MKNYLIILLVILFAMNACDNKVVDEVHDNYIPKNDSEEYLNLPDVISDLTFEIRVKHYPDTIYAEIRDSNTYIWKHSTTIKAIESNVQIIEFGTYNYKAGEWILGNYSKKPFTAKEFEAWYFKKSEQDLISWENCKDAYLIKGQEYIDPSNWSITNDSLVERNGLWYYVGINDNGEKVAGYGRYYIVPQLKNE